MKSQMVVDPREIYRRMLFYSGMVREWRVPIFWTNNNNNNDNKIIYSRLYCSKLGANLSLLYIEMSIANMQYNPTTS